jgi:hypothetical protein
MRHPVIQMSFCRLADLTEFEVAHKYFFLFCNIFFPVEVQAPEKTVSCHYGHDD